MQLADAIAIQNFESAARLRDELDGVKLSAMQLVELDCVHQLATGTEQEQRGSLKKLSQLAVCDETQESIAKLLKNHDLSVRMRQTASACTFCSQPYTAMQHGRHKYLAVM